MTDRELMQQALDALEEIHPDNMTTIAEKSWSKAIEALRAVLAQPEPYAAQAAIVAQQTQGRMYVDPVTGDVGIGNPNQVTLDTSGATTFSLTPIDWDASAPLVVTPHPAFKKPWVGLTDEEIESTWQRNLFEEYIRKGDVRTLGRAIEAKLKEKNT